nr:glutamate receptor ionotropic, delta-1-like [Penaeus vannamei]
MAAPLMSRLLCLLLISALGQSQDAGSAPTPDGSRPFSCRGNRSRGLAEVLLRRMGSDPFPSEGGRSSEMERPSAKWSGQEPRILADLLPFLVTSTTARQILLIHDLSAPNISPAIRAVYEQWYGVTTISFQSAADFLDFIVKALSNVSEKRIAIVICSGGNTVAIFEAIREKDLESPKIQWFVVMRENLTFDLTAALREGTQITLAAQTSSNSYRLSTSYVDVKNKIGLAYAGHVTWNDETGKMTPFLASPLTPDLERVYADFGGRQLKGAVVPNWPFFQVTPLDAYDGPYQEAGPVSGIDFLVIDAIATELNFTYKLLVADSWGGPQPDGRSITGMIGMVARREVEFAVDEITITGAREAVLDFSQPYFMESITIVSRAPAEKSRAVAVFSPFTPAVWAALVLSVAVIGPLLAAVNHLTSFYLGGKDHFSSREFAFNMFRNLVVQGNLISSARWPLRCVFFSWYLFCFYVCALYSGTLTAVLAIPAFEKPIDSLADLLRAMKEDGFSPLFIYDTSNVHILKEATSGIYKEIWDRFQPDSGYVFSANEGVDKVLTGKFGFVNAWLASEIRITARGKENYHLARQTYYPQSYGVALQSGAPYLAVFDKKLAQLVESGLIGKWRRDVVGSAAGRVPDEGPQGGPGAVTLIHLQAAFFVLAVGLLAASLALGFEVGFCRRRRRRRRVGKNSKSGYELSATTMRKNGRAPTSLRCPVAESKSEEKLMELIERSSSLKWDTAADNHAGEQYSK